MLAGVTRRPAYRSMHVLDPLGPPTAYNSRRELSHKPWPEGLAPMQATDQATCAAPWHCNRFASWA